ncbi:MAG: hypothetical protein IMZ54_12605, partial [Acidobacteria bacterium]|nr:hypothetical protein [Acidobacteriota bacterium]
MIARRRAAKPKPKPVEHSHWKLVTPDGSEREYWNRLVMERDGRDGDELYVWMVGEHPPGEMQWV